MLFDTHTHLDDEAFDDSRAEILQRARAADVLELVAVGTTADSSRRCVALAGKYEGVYAAVGIQPNYVAEAVPDDWSVVEQLVGLPGVVAIGETGLDRYWDFTPFEQQQEFFDRHLRLAQRHGLPFVVHMRDCEAEIVEMLRGAHQRGPLEGIMHSFTGDAVMAAECIEMGLYISFAGMVTFKKSQPLRDCVATVPADRLLLETDAPYLSPEPVRKIGRNEPAFLRHTAECIAAVRGISVAALAAQTTANARRLFQID